MRIAVAALILLAACASPTGVELVDSTANVEDEIGQPCDPATYAGQYRCLPSESSMTGYAIAN